MEWVHQVIYNMIVTKYIDSKVFDYIDPCGETLSSVSLEIISLYHRTIGFASGQYIYSRDILFNLASAVDWWVLTDRNQQQFDIAYVCAPSNSDLGVIYVI